MERWHKKPQDSTKWNTIIINSSYIGPLIDKYLNASMTTPTKHLTDTIPYVTDAVSFFIHHGEIQTASNRPYVVMASISMTPHQGGQISDMAIHVSENG